MREEATIDTRALLDDVARGDKRAFAAFYDRWSTPVFRFAQIATSSRQAAEDLTAEVFLCVWRQPCEYRHRGEHPAVWLLTVAQSLLSAPSETIHPSRREPLP